MQIHPKDPLTESIVTALSDESTANYREPGIHLSGILDFMESRGNASSGGFWEPVPLSLSANLGIGWEEVLERRALKELGVERPKPRQVDGIWMSPDGFDGSFIWEYKLKWASARNFIPSEKWRILTQIRSYCYGWGVRHGYLIVCFAAGSYDGQGPKLSSWRVSFSPEEIERGWKQIMEMKTLLQEQEKPQ